MTTTATIPGKALDNAARAALKRYNDSKAAIKAAEAVKAEAEAELRAFLGDATTALFGGQRVLTLESRVRSGIDVKALNAGWPEAAAACRTETAYTFLKTL